MSSKITRETRPIVQFWLLAGLLVFLFLTGGSQRADVPSLQLLRPVAVLLAAYGLFTLRLSEWRHYRHIVFLMISVLTLILLHLVPLPPDVWQVIPGRSIVRDVDGLMEISDNWRPLSMAPDGTTNALFSLAVPIAVFALAAQIDLRGHVGILGVLLVLAILSGGFGVFQAIGLDPELYGPSGDVAGLFANRNHQGVLLAMIFPMLSVATVLASAWGGKERLAIIVAAALAVIVVPLVIITGSRAGLISSLLAAPLVLFIGLRRIDADRRRGTVAILVRVAFVVTIVAALIWLTIAASRETALARFEASEGDLRLPVWGSIVDALPTYMPWGSGIGSYAEVYQILEPDRLLRPTFSNHAHSEWLEIAFTAGVPGMALLLWAVILFFYTALRAYRAPGLPGVFGRLGLSLIVLLAFASTFDYPVRIPIMSSVLAIAAVWAASFRRFGNEDGTR